METYLQEKKQEALTSINDILFPLLRNGLYEDRAPEMIPQLSAGQWDELLETAQRQTVAGIMYHGLSRLGTEYEVPTDVTFRLVAEANRIEQESKRKEAVAWKEFQRMKEEGLHPIVMKGPAIARHYPTPHLRVSGDIDIYLRGDEFHKVRASLGDKVELADGSVHYACQGVDFDLHDKYFDLYLPESRLPAVPSPYATLLMLSAHIFKHASGPGIGLRQLCDMAVAYHKLDFEPEALLETYRRAGLLKWNVLLYSFLRKYLGLKDIFGDSIKPVPPETLLAIIEEGGNFGHYEQSRKAALSGETRERKIDTAKRYIRRLPFALKYAPREAFRYFLDLVLGNLKKKNPS